MKTYHRTVIEPLRIEEDGKIFELKRGERVLTSEVRDSNDGPVVTVLASYWVTAPVSHFDNKIEPAYGHEKKAGAFI